MTSFEQFGKVLNVEPSFLEQLDAEMTARTGKQGVFENLAHENKERWDRVFQELGLRGASATVAQQALQDKALAGERELLQLVGEQVSGASHFHKTVLLVAKIAHGEEGFFLKKDFAKEILRQCPPQQMLGFFGYTRVDELLRNHDVTEVFSALRFVESVQWMHETFAKAYNNFTKADFEERPIEIKVLGDEWKEVAEKFVEKKHHNVSHLKEFGVIFLDPIHEDVPGSFLRDFALLLHYSHEIQFYSKLFRKYLAGENFAEKFKMLLRGDVKEVNAVGTGQWLIVQRYLFKENPADPRLFLPHVNPESLHWARGERDLAEFAKAQRISLSMWGGLDWVASSGDMGEVVSFDLEDNIMSAIVSTDHKREHLTYHQREALWTKIFSLYAGGEESMEKLLVDHFDEGMIQFI